MFCNNCGQSLPDGSAFCGNCGASLQPPVEVEPDRAVAADVKKSKKKLWIIGAIAAVIVVAVLVIVLVLSAAGGPLADILGAVEKTVEAGSFSAEVERYRDGELQYTATIEAKCNLNKKELTFFMRDDYGDVEALYDGYQISGYSYNGGSYAYAYDISDEQDAFFEYYDKIDLADLSDADLADLLEDLDLPRRAVREIEDAVDLDEAQDGFETVMGWLNDEDWLEENLGFEASEKNGITTYTFKGDSRDLRSVLKDALKEFESALDDDFYDELRDAIGHIENGYDFTLAICLDGGYLSSAEFSYDTGYHEYTYVFTLDDIGKTRIDTGELEKWLEIANDWDD